MKDEKLVICFVNYRGVRLLDVIIDLFVCLLLFSSTILIASATMDLLLTSFLLSR